MKAENDAEHANDAVQKSNMAILLLPLMMNLVPVALFADVNTLGMIVYTALTDVLTAVPLAIKGWELLDISANSHTVAASYYTGEMGPGENAIAELFIAKCHTFERRVGIGISFIVVAVVFMIFGVSFELFAKRYMRRRRPYAPYQPVGPGAMLLQQGVTAAARVGPRGGTRICTHQGVSAPVMLGTIPTQTLSCICEFLQAVIRMQPVIFRLQGLSILGITILDLNYFPLTVSRWPPPNTPRITIPDRIYHL